MCNTTAAKAIAPNESVDSIEVTELVRGSDGRLLEQVGPLVRRQSVSLDLGSVCRIDAAGISALVALYSTACDAGHSFTVCNASPRVAEVLALVGLDRILISHDAVGNPYSGFRLQRQAA
jgi:anti-anti-sigma factor